MGLYRGSTAGSSSAVYAPVPGCRGGTSHSLCYECSDTYKLVPASHFGLLMWKGGVVSHH